MSPEYTEVILDDLVLDVVEAHVYRFLLAFIDVVVGNALGGRIIHCYCCSGLWMAHFN